jgi:branched-chain amino acid aminotransferase
MKNALSDAIKANNYHENLAVRQTLFVDGFGSLGSSEPVEMFVAPIPKANISSEYI